MEKVYANIQMAIIMKGNGLTTRSLDKVSNYIKMVGNMRVNG